MRVAVGVLLARAAGSVDARADELHVSDTHSGTIPVIETKGGKPFSPTAGSST